MEDKSVLKYLIDEFHRRQAELTNDERTALWSMIMRGYCKHCGCKVEDGERCYCENDD